MLRDGAGPAMIGSQAPVALGPLVQEAVSEPEQALGIAVETVENAVPSAGSAAPINVAEALRSETSETVTDEAIVQEQVSNAEAPAGEASESASAAPEQVPAEPSPEVAVGPAVQGVTRRARRAARHQPVNSAVGHAIAASERAAVTQVRMAEGQAIAAADTAQTGQVDRSTFEQELQRAIDESMPEPSTDGEAREVIAQGGRRAAARISQTMRQQQAEAVGDLPARVGEGSVPDPSTQSVAPQVTLVPETPGNAPSSVSPEPVVPPPSTEAAIDISANRDGVDQLQADNEITEAQLTRGNEPDFQATLGARAEAEQHDREAPQRLRVSEGGDLAQTRERSAGTIGSGLAAFHDERIGRLTNVAGQQTSTQGLTEARKQEITNHIAAIGQQTRQDVTEILTAMDDAVNGIFRTAINEAMAAYDAAFEDEKGGWLTAIGDFFSGIDDRFKRALLKGRAAFDQRIRRAISEIAATVERKLQEARARVGQGREEIDLYMTERVSEAERNFAAEAASAIAADFDALEGEIDQRKDVLVARMVDLYREGIQRRNEREAELREANKSIWQRVWDATVGVIQKVAAFKDMLLGVLAGAAAVVGAIIQDPIGFLGNLIAGIGAGLRRFVTNIATNLQNALMGWLFGALEGAGIRMPQRFDIMGFIDVIMQVLGLTRENVRARAVRILGEDMVAKIEAGVEFIRVLFTEGPAGIWRMLLEKLGEIKDTIIGEIKSWVMTRIIQAGINWLLGLLNPASAFIKACMAIYEIIKFFIERGQQIIDAVNAIIGALGTIVAGNIAAMAQAVEGALNRILPVVIGFLAALLGLVGISTKIRQVIERVRQPVNRAIDWVINKGVAVARRIRGLFGRRDEKADEEDLGEVKNSARQRLKHLIGNGASLEEVREHISIVRSELRPLGLKGLDIGPENDEGERGIFAEASLRKRLGVLANKSVVVGLSARITVGGPPVLEGIERQAIVDGRLVPAETIRFVGLRAHQRALFGPRGAAAQLPEVHQPPGSPGRSGFTQPSSGFIIEPEADSRELEVVTWNTSEPEFGSNVSHAERQFYEWFDDRPVVWKRRVVSVRLEIEGRPVCDRCEAHLTELADLYPHIEFSWPRPRNTSERAAAENLKFNS